jgi:diamine N-acetyltransferase
VNLEAGFSYFCTHPINFVMPKIICIQDPDQIPLLQRVIQETYLTNFSHYWFDGGEMYKERISNTQHLAAELANPNSRYYFAYLDSGEIAGFMKLIFNSQVHGQQIFQAVCLDKVYLYPHFTGQGVGRMLIDFAKSETLAAGAKHLWLRVMVQNDSSRRVYEKAGFEALESEMLHFPEMKPEFDGITTMLCTLE